MLVLSATAALSAALAMVLHDRTLAADLERAAEQRLERAANSANRLVDDHLASLKDRYRAVSRTPELRASVEVGHTPTLDFYAESLRRREGPALVAFFDPSNRPIASSGREELVEAARSVETAALVARGSEAFAVVSTDLHTPSGRVGRMVAVEPVTKKTLSHWSELCGADVRLLPPGASDESALAKAARSLGPLDLVVAVSLDAEAAALRRSRASLIASGSLAVTLSLVACVLLARGFVRPIIAIQHAADRIRRGDLELRLNSDRQDEIGEVARAFDLMLDNWVESRGEIERNVAELERSRQHLANAQDLARLGSFEIRFEKGVPGALHGSEQLRKLFQLEPGPGLLDLDALVARIAAEDRDVISAGIREALETGSALRSDFRLQPPDGTERIMHVEAHPSRDEDSRDEETGSVRLEGTVQDVTERRRADEQIRFLSHHDPLTGLGNRLHFSECLGLALAKTVHRGAGVGVLLVDLDHFKRINDTLGPTVGDEVLRVVAHRLVTSLRETDVVSRDVARDGAISRLAGDEFTLLLNDIDDAKDLAFVASRLLYNLSSPIEVQGQEVVLNASIGISTWPSDGLDVDALLTSAGSAMQHAKQRGGNRFEFYDESMRKMGGELIALEARLRRALTRGEFQMHYQPVMALSEGRVVGFEALMRWNDPQAGLLPPRDFIPVAEHCGLIVPLGELALREACRQLVAWRHREGTPKVAVNLSPIQFRTGEVVDSVASILEESGAPADRLELEITESAVMHDEKGVIRDLERLRAMGISIALDDFGTGQSSLSYLRRLPVDTLKVDMSFVRNIEHSAEDARLTAAIVALGRARGLRVVAEGVETVGQRRLLAQWRCDEIQGFLISAALPPEQAIELAERIGRDGAGET